MKVGSAVWPSVALFAAAFVTTASCQGSAAAALKGPGGYYDSQAAVSADGWVYFLRFKGSMDVPPELWRTREHQSPQSMGPVHSTSASCTDPRLGFLRGTSQGDITATALCGTGGGFVSVALTGGPGQVSAKVLATLPGNGDVAWDSGLDQGWISHNDGLGCVGIARLTGGGVEHFGDYAPIGQLTWPIDGDFFAAGAYDCRGRGRAGFVAIDSNNDRLMFLASPASQGIYPSDPRRASAPWDLYIYSPRQATMTRSLGGFTDPKGIAIVDRGRAVLVSATRGTAAGIWWVDLAGGTVKQVAHGSFGPPALSPDGTRCYAVKNPAGSGSTLAVIALPHS